VNQMCKAIMINRFSTKQDDKGAATVLMNVGR
jgi:hypothetical protein